MDVFQFIGYLRQFSVDVALIGAAVWGIDLLLRRTLLKKAKGKLAAFLPFLLGIALYAAYAAATGGFAEGADAAAVLTEGMTCGSVATVLRVLFEGRGDAKTECVKALLAGYEVSDEAAKNIAARVGKDEAGAKELLAEIAGGENAEALYPLLEKTLAAL